MAQLFEDMKRRYEALQNRKIYSELNPEILASIPDEELEYAILDYVALKVGNGHEREHEIITSLPLGFQAFYTTLGVDLEIPNGGFNQYFWNRGQFALEAVEGYKMIGAMEHAKLMEEAVVTYMAEAETHKRFRIQNTLQAFSESYQHTTLNELDKRYYRLEDDTDTANLRTQFVRQHPEAFVAL